MDNSKRMKQVFPELSQADAPWDNKEFAIQPFESQLALTRGDNNDTTCFGEYREYASQLWKCERRNGFFIFSAKQSDKGRRGYLAVDKELALIVVEDKTKAGNFVALKDPSGGWELSLFQLENNQCGGTIPLLKPMDDHSGRLVAVKEESPYRLGFTLHQ